MQKFTLINKRQMWSVRSLNKLTSKHSYIFILYECLIRRIQYLLIQYNIREQCNFGAVEKKMRAHK